MRGRCIIVESLLFKVYICYMISGMYFVYSLTCDNSVFYIGMTNNLAARYSSHLNSHRAKRPTAVATHIGHLLSINKVIKLIIIDYLPREEAEKKERDIIYLFSCAGHFILNEQHTLFKFRNHNKWDFENKKAIINHLKYRQYLKEDTYCCLNNIDYEQATGERRDDAHKRFRQNLLQSKGLSS